jgi:hypothetical protein
MTAVDATTEHATADTATSSGALVGFGIAAVLVALMAAATVTFGLPGLSMVALALVPVMYLVLLILCMGK